MSTYFVFHARIHDAEKMEEYYQQAGETLTPCNHELPVIDDNPDVIEGNMNFPRTVVLKFDSREDAMSWYQFAAYQKALPLRKEAAECFTVFVEGLQ